MLKKIRIKKVNNQGAHHAEGVVVVIDVLRAFTTAAFAFAAGTKEIILVKEKEEALALRKNIPNSLIIGEVDYGHPCSEFDFGNSPSQIKEANLQGKTIIQRTSAGTQGAVNARHAKHLLLGSFCTAEATLSKIESCSPKVVTFVITSSQSIDEDLALADYLEARLLLGKDIDPAPYLRRVENSLGAQLFKSPKHLHMPKEDLDLALQIDRFDFGIQVEGRGTAHISHSPTSILLTGTPYTL